MSELNYQTSVEGITADQISNGFFAGWPDPPTPETLLDILAASDHTIIAVEDGHVIGFVAALSDGILSAFITLLEVVPERHNQGVGDALINQVLDEIGDIYMVDLVCDANLSRFYAKLGFATTTGMSRRDYAMQAGRQR